MDKMEIADEEENKFNINQNVVRNSAFLKLSLED